jgi:hypothetical protein
LGGLHLCSGGDALSEGTHLGQTGGKVHLAGLFIGEGDGGGAAVFMVVVVIMVAFGMFMFMLVFFFMVRMSACPAHHQACRHYV